MTSEEIRNKFLNFFKDRHHTIVPSSSLVSDDPSVLFTTAGMQQFKPYYTGQADPISDFGSQNTVSIQRCLRTSDIEEVGDETHLTFFEMLGNFSFGDYGKKKAIEYAHEFITKILNLKIDYVSVFEGDDQFPADEDSEKIWKSLDSTIEIRKAGREDNFWGPTGDAGPCGPTTEIYVNGIEVWNIVFNQYYAAIVKIPYYANKVFRHGNSSVIVPAGVTGLFASMSPQLGIDTGMGLERLALVAQQKKNLYETDLFQPILDSIIEVQGDKPIEQIRLIADHLRAVTFLIADGIEPGKDERNYVPRLLIRRATTAHYLYLGTGLNKNFFHNPVNTIIDLYKKSYPYLAEKREVVFSVIQKEIENFSKVLLLIGTINDLKKAYNSFIPKTELKNKSFDTRIKGKTANLDARILFRIRETLGVNYQVMKMIIKKSGLELGPDVLTEYDKAYRDHQELSRAASVGMFKGGLVDHEPRTIKHHTAHHLLLGALRQVLGNNVFQRGSNVSSERLRIDFSHPEKLTKEQLEQVEKVVNQKILEDLEVKREEMPKEQAEKLGALAEFGAKYSDVVSVYTIYNKDGSVFSREFCGGPHVNRTRELGKFKIKKEEAVSAGIRRIRAELKS